jgi:DNA polymerase/3'-5' exonuclease PolX
MTNTTEVARLLLEWALHLEFRGDNPYKSRAYRRAAEGLVQPA